MKHLLLALTAILLFSSCNKKTDDNPGASGPNFAINGVHDLTLDPTTPGNAVLTLAVNTVTAGGPQEPVTISVSGLPAGITAEMTTASGTPNFGTMITFKNDFSAAGGSYPVKITGRAASGVKEYTMNLIVPSFKGWIVTYPVGPVSYVFSQSSMTLKPGSNDPGDFPQAIIHSGSDRIFVTFSQADGLPTKAGTFTTVDSKNIASGQVEIEVYEIGGRTPGNGWYMSDPGGTVRVAFENGKLQIKGSDLNASGTSGPAVKLAISALQ